MQKAIVLGLLLLCVSEVRATVDDACADDSECAATVETCDTTIPNGGSAGTCKLSLDSDCTGNTDKCVDGAECETAGGKTLCKLGVGATCVAGSGNTGEKCATNSVCGDVDSSGSVTCECPSPFVTEDNLCKSGVGASCTSSTALCINTATCEGTSCKIKHSQSCSGTGTAANCVANAQCVNSTCKCDGTENSDGTCNAAGSGVSVTASLILLLSTQLIFRLF